MGLSLLDCQVGTIVDLTYDVDADTGKLTCLDQIRRGIITKIDGNGQDSVKAIWVRFEVGGKDERVQNQSLVRVYPAGARQAKEAYRRIIGQPKHVGAVFQSRHAAQRRQVVDKLALTAGRPSGFVEPEYDESNIAGMELTDGAGPVLPSDVIGDVPEEPATP